MPDWRNWSGRQAGKIDALHFLRSETDAVGLVNQCRADNARLKVVGSGHSHSPVALGNEVVADVSGLSGVISVNSENDTAWIRAGSTIYSLGGQLHGDGLALRNQGDIDRQVLAGAISTGTHGTGESLQNLSASVSGLTLVLADGELVTCSESLEPDLFQAARLGLGCVGLITRVEMQLTQAKVLKEHSWQASFDDLVDNIPEQVAANERFEFFWYPGNDRATVKTINPVAEAPVYPVAEEGSRQAYSYEVLPSHRPHLHTEMEYSVPQVSGQACLKEIRELLRTEFPDVIWPVEYRTVAADDVWLSMAYGRPTVTISVHQDIREDDEPYFRACEAIFLKYGGRPHWGKVNYLGAAAFEDAYPMWQRWWQVRDEFDPQGMFLNTWAAGLRG